MSQQASAKVTLASPNRPSFENFPDSPSHDSNMDIYTILPPPLPVSTPGAPKKWKIPSPAPEMPSSPCFIYSCGNPDATDWKQIENVSFSEEGSQGVVFVNMAGNGTVVLKGSGTIPQDYFATLIAEELGIPVPHMRIIDYSNGTTEWRELLNSLKAWTATNGSVKTRKGLGKRCFIECMEMVVGQQLSSLSLGDAIRYFCGSTDESIDFLTQIGRLIALDVVLNNWDRVPVLWENDGNWTNVIVSHSQEKLKIVGIDNGFSFISSEHGEKLDLYCKKVLDLISSARNSFSRDEECPQLAAIRASFSLQSGFQIPPNVLIHTQKGLLDGLHDISQRLTEDRIDSIVAQVRGAIVRDWGGMWEHGMRAVESKFLHKVLSTIKTAF